MEQREKVAIEESKINLEFRFSQLFVKSHWRLLEDRILIYKKGTVVDELFLEDITVFHVFNPQKGQLQLFAGNDLYTLFAEPNDMDFYKAGDYVRENCGVNRIKKWQDSLDFRMRCNVCGQVFCYTYTDLMNNARFAQLAKNHGRDALVNALIGTPVGVYGNMKLGNDAVGRITDYSRCPHCNSSSLTEITKEEWDAGKVVENKPVQPVVTSSAADEIKKFKELLDSGIITQEEFDAKKKQLLGL